METFSTAERNNADVSLPRSPQAVRLPRWFNDPLPDPRAILSVSEISRLTRCPCWLLMSLTAIGRFPKPRIHCGRRVGWHRTDVLDWLTRHMAATTKPTSAPQGCRRQGTCQASLPLEYHLLRRNLHRWRGCHCAR